MVASNLAYSLNTDSQNVKHLNKSETNELNWCSVSLSEVISMGMRLEATVFDIEGKKAREIIANCKYDTKVLAGREGVALAYTCPRFKRNWVEVSQYPIFQPSSILELYPKPDGYIAANTDTDIEKLRVEKNQILLTCSGTIGKVVYVSDTLAGNIFSHDLLRITCNDKVDAGYLYAYIRSDIGNKLITTNQYGAVVSHIEASHLSDIPIPYPERAIREHISSKIVKSYQLRDEANRLLEKAYDLLYSDLGLESFYAFKEKMLDPIVNNYSIKLSDLEGRIDASYHDILASSIIKQIEKNAECLKELRDKNVSRDIFLPERFKRTYVSKGHGTKMFGIKQITTLDPYTDKYLALGCIKKEQQKKLLLETGMLLVSRSGTIGNMCIVPPHWKNWIASEDLIRVKVVEGMEGYVYCFLSSDYGQALIHRYSFGSVQDHIDCEQVGKIIIPMLKNKALQQEINDLVIECNELRAKAYYLELEAIEILNRKVFNIS